MTVNKNFLINSNGTISYWQNKYWQNKNRHREDGPAIIYSSGAEEYYLNGILHREDGPAITLLNKSFWYYHGTFINVSSQKEFVKYLVNYTLTDSQLKWFFYYNKICQSWIEKEFILTKLEFSSFELNEIIINANKIGGYSFPEYIKSLFINGKFAMNFNEFKDLEKHYLSFMNKIKINAK